MEKDIKKIDFPIKMNFSQDLENQKNIEYELI